MKYRQWFFLALSLLLLAVALVGVRSFGGSADKASAQTPQVALDLDSTGGWCATIENTDTVTTGTSPTALHQAAICMLGSNWDVNSFNIVVNYTSSLNSCTNTGQTGTGLDANPNFVWTGGGWDCSGGQVNYPYCAGTTAGQAFISCGTTTDPGTVTGNWPIAVIEWNADDVGSDVLSFGTAALYSFDGENVMRCPDAVNCIGATVTKSGEPAAPSATPTSTMTPTATATECPGRICPTSTVTPRAWTKTPTPAPTGTPVPSEPGEPAQPPPPPPPPPSGGAMPQVVPPGTGTGSGSGDWTTSLMWTLAGAGALSVFLGGLYLRRARNR